MFKFLPGIILIQLVTGGLVIMALNWAHDFQLVIVIAMVAFFSAILSAFWFSSIARNIYHDQQTALREQHAQDREKFLKQAGEEKASAIQEKSQLQDTHARERERILLDTEREKSNIIAASYEKIEKETRKAHAKANFKVGVAFATAVGAGGIMIFSQLVTVGVMFLVASGSGLSGYILRARQERISRNKQNRQRLITVQTDISTAKKMVHEKHERHES